MSQFLVSPFLNYLKFLNISQLSSQKYPNFIGNFIQKLGKVQERTKFLFMAHKEWFIAYDGCSEAGGSGDDGPGEAQGRQVCNHPEI